jgi:hypothetical protein
MKEVTVSSFSELERLLKKDALARKRVVLGGVRSTAKRAKRLLKQSVPVAFGELRESIGDEKIHWGARNVIDAPYAAAVELGARPHWIPIEPLLAWVKLRAAQGLLRPSRIGRLPGSTTRAHAINIAGQLRAMEKDGALDVGAPMRIARAIQHKLARTGTPPHWFARDALPDIMEMLDIRIRAALAAEEEAEGDAD